MKKKEIKICTWTIGLVTIVCLVLMLICLFLCEKGSDDPVKILKNKIDKAEMIEFVDSFYSAKLLYPDFFRVDTTGKLDDIRFYFSDENVKDLSLGLSYYPPRSFENIDNFIRICESDSMYVCLEKKKRSFILKGKDGPNSEYIYLIKYTKGRYWWIVCTLTYEPQYENSVKRLIKIVKKLKPMPDENTPVWSDICDFLDI